jgi:hypothetical protein
MENGYFPLPSKFEMQPLDLEPTELSVLMKIEVCAGLGAMKNNYSKRLLRMLSVDFF